ncbi:MAG: hypothetical protein V1709_03025 [Planctomycetota bacterium]
MLSTNKIILIMIVACIFQWAWFLNHPLGDPVGQSTILAEDKKGDFQPIEGRLIYSDDWSFLSDVTTPLPIITQIKENYVTLPNSQNPKGYHCTSEKDKVRLDMDGDYLFDTELKDKENFITYKIKYPNGLPLDYRMRIFSKTSIQSSQTVTRTYPTWYYQRACYMTVKTPLENFTVIDDNNNGYFNDYGKDAIIIGTAGKQAVPLSSIIMVKGKYYNLQVESVLEIPKDAKNIPNYTGMVLILTPYNGDTGKIDIMSNFKAPKDSPQTAIIRRDNDAFLQLTNKGSVVVPTGNYYLVSAVLNKRVHVRGGDKTLGKVEKDKTLLPKWGSPFKLNLNPYCEKGGDIPIIIQVPDSLSNTTLATYTPKHMDCPFIKMQFPTVTGLLGEEYYATDEFKDDKGLAFPDGGVVFFKVEIRPKDAPPNQKTINATVGNAYVQKWIPMDLSSQAKQVAPFWEYYRCPIEKYRGKVIVKVSAQSRMFGDLLFEQEVDVKAQ